MMRDITGKRMKTKPSLHLLITGLMLAASVFFGAGDGYELHAVMTAEGEDIERRLEELGFRREESVMPGEEFVDKVKKYLCTRCR